jgi:ribosome maturation factor RimP
MNGHQLGELRKVAEEVSAQSGCYLYDLELVGSGPHRVLRVTIDKDSRYATRSGDALAHSDSDLVPQSVPQFAPSNEAQAEPESTEAQLTAGVSIEDCSNVSRGLSEKLDASEDLLPGGQYSLEVSSPGLERVLKEERHFAKVIGQKISAKTLAPLVDFNQHLPALGKAKQIQGILVSVDSKGFRVTADDKRHDELVYIPFEMLTKSHVVFEFTESGAKKGKPGHKSKGDRSKS